MKKRVLILGIASVQMDAILQLKKMGYETYACAMAKDGPGADVADNFEIINILDKESIIEYINKNDIALVYSVGSDLAMPVSAYISEKLNMPHFVSSETAIICNNKNLMREVLGHNFKGNLRYQIIENEEEKVELEYPFIVKPTDSQGQRGVRLVGTHHQYLEAFRIAKQFSRSGLVIIEQYISGVELSVNGYMVDGELKFLEVSDRDTWPNYTGLIHKHIVPSAYVNEKILGEIREIIKASCEKLQVLNGPVYAQMKLEKNEPYIIEITPRLDGCHMWNILKEYTGVNLLKLTFEHLINGDISELNKVRNKNIEKCILEFICQQPNTKADYTKYKKKIEDSIYAFNYYKQGDKIRPVNGKYDKIGYFIHTKEA